MTLVHYQILLWYVPCYNVTAVNNVILMEQVNPNSGPYQGGTDVTIIGTELGVVFEDIINITIGGSLCIIYNDSYHPGVG